MIKNIFKSIYKHRAVLPMLVIIAFLPTVANAYSGSLTYRSTVFGTGVEKFSSGYNRVVNEKSNFNTNDQVHVLTRVYNITSINNFQIKHQLYRDGSFVRDFYSTAYQPNRNWWAETYAWNNLGSLSSGEYKVRVYISVDNESYQFYRDVVFRVVGNTPVVNTYNQYDNYNQNTPTNYQPYYNYDSRFLDSQPGYNFNFVWTHTGTDIRDLGTYVFETVNQKDTFNENERVFAVGKLTDIRGIDRFKMKYDIYLNNTFYKTLYSWEQKPTGNYWKYNYTWVNFDRLPAGHYNLKTSISINGGSYTSLNTKNIVVYQVYGNYSGGTYYQNPNTYYNNNLPGINNDYNYTNYPYNTNVNNYPYNNRRNPQNRNNRNRGSLRDSDYDYQKMTTGVGATKANTNNCGSNYRIQKSKNIFSSSESVKVVTEVELLNARRVEIRHDLHLNNSSNSSKSLTAYANCGSGNYKVRTGFYSDFGRIQRGNHKIKSYIRMNNGSWQYLDFRNIKIQSSSGNYKHDWTRLGTGNSSNGWYSYSPSLRQKTNFSAGESLSVVTKLDNVDDLDNYRIKYELYRGNNLDRTLESPRIHNYNYNYNNNDKEYYWVNFGFLYPGSYRLRVYVSTNNGGYTSVESKNFYTENNNYNYSNYNYNY